MTTMRPPHEAFERREIVGRAVLGVRSSLIQLKEPVMSRPTAFGIGAIVLVAVVVNRSAIEKATCAG